MQLPPLKRHSLTRASVALVLGWSVLSSHAAPVAALPELGDAPQVFRTTIEQDNLWDIAGKIAPAAGVSRQQVMVAVLRRNPQAFVKGNIHRLRTGVPLVLPSLGDARAEDKAKAIALVDSHRLAMKSGAVLAPLGLLPGAKPSPALPVPDKASSKPAAPASAPVAPPPPASAVAPAPAPVPAAVASEPTPAPAPASAVVAAPSVPSTPSAPEAAASKVAEPPPETPPAASAVAEPAAPPVAPVSEAVWLRYLPHVLVLGAAAIGWWQWQRGRFKGALSEAEAPEAEQGVAAGGAAAARTSTPRNLDVSNAAAEMARTVETSLVVKELVRADASVSVEVSSPTVSAEVHAALKLELARAQLDVGQTEAARAVLRSVVLESSGRYQAEAAEILARLG